MGEVGGGELEEYRKKVGDTLKKEKLKRVEENLLRKLKKEKLKRIEGNLLGELNNYLSNIE